MVYPIVDTGLDLCTEICLFVETIHELSLPFNCFDFLQILLNVFIIGCEFSFMEYQGFFDGSG